MTSSSIGSSLSYVSTSVREWLTRPLRSVLIEPRREEAAGRNGVGQHVRNLPSHITVRRS